MRFFPLVSIVIPVYNGSNYVSQAIDSALGQTYKNIEIIVVNDGSTDNGETDRICKSYGDKIRYFIKENGKCSSALNYGISKMNGDYFSWLSHDDLYEADKIEKQITAIETNSINTDNTIIGSANSLIDKEGNLISYRKNVVNGKIDCNTELKNLLFKRTPNGNGFLISREILRTVGEFDTNLVFINDWDYWIRVALNGFDFFYVADFLVKSRVHTAQQTNLLFGLYREEVIKSILNYLTEEGLNEKDYKVLFYYCYYFNDKNLKNAAKKILREKGVKISYFKAFYFSIKGSIINLLKKIKRKIVYKK